MTKPLRVEFAFEMPARELPMPAAALRRDVTKAARESGFTGSLSFAVVSDATIRRVNREFHDCDEPTDVLAFALGGGGAEGFDSEVIVSLDTARREAAAHGVEPAAELLLYAVHGVLHLMGFDDHRLADARRMHARAVAILEALGHRNTIVPRAKTRGAPRKTKRSMRRE